MTGKPQNAAPDEPRGRGMDWRDMVGLAGAAALVGGACWIYPPAGLIVGGVLALCLAVAGARKGEE